MGKLVIVRIIEVWWNSRRNYKQQSLSKLHFGKVSSNLLLCNKVDQLYSKHTDSQIKSYVLGCTS